MTSPTHQALIVLLDPESLDVLDVYVGLGPNFAIGEKHGDSGGIRLLLSEARCSTIDQTNRTIWQMATKDYPWTLHDKEGELRSVGEWVWRYEQTSRDVRLEDCVIWGRQ